ADVSVFRGLAGELSGSGAAEAPPALGMNYRSEPELVTFFNELFSRVFAGASEEYEARFSPIGHREPTPGLKPEILYLYKRRAAGGGELLSEDEALADGVARYIRSAVGRLPLKSAEVGAPRRAEPDDFAILLRSTAKQYLIERFLRLHQLPYTVDSPRGLFLESVANDIYAALHLCLYEDRASYAAVLRSPLVRLSDDGFVCVLASGQRVFGQAEEELLDSSDRERFRRGREMLGRLRAMADRRPCAELVRSLWYEEGLRLAILRKPGAEPYLDHYDYLLALAVRADAEGRSLAAFISSLEPLMGRPERLDELEVPRESARGVRIMTIHKAKGLEFPVVILPGMEGGGQADGVGAAWYLSPSVGVTVNLKSFDDPKARSSNVFYESEREKEERRRAAESRRLFYVACTRASAHLVFAGVEPNAARGPSFHSFLCAESAAGDPAAEEGREGTGLEPMPGLPAAVRLVELPDLTTSAYLGLFGGSVPRPLEPRLPEYRNAANIERHWERRTLGVAEINAAYWEELGATGESESLPACDYDGHAATVSPARFGELCHAVLECELLGRDRTPALAGALDALPAELRGLLHADAQRMGRGFLQSPLGGLLRRARDLRTEWAFLLDLGEGSTAAGRIDLAFRHEDCLYVVDFKSDRERRPGEYDLQLELYRRAAAALLPAGSVKSYLFWLRSGEAEERAGEHSSGELRRWIGLAARSRPSGAGA
ncbi:MAG TPA: 3'-5' exonuclease, partial [Rectinemataceae bacterium]|nr:3'-5' exonuclease [Rectinemataceae bacterium]